MLSHFRQAEDATLPFSIHAAATSGKVDVVLDWLDGGGQIDARGGELEITLLMLACDKYGNVGERLRYDFILKTYNLRVRCKNKVGI